MADEPQYETRAERRAADEANRRGGAHRAAASSGRQKAAIAVVIILALVAVLLIVGAVNIIRSAGSDPEAKIEEQQELEKGAPGGAEETDKSESADDESSDKPSEEPSEDSATETEESDGASSDGISTVKAETSDPKISILNASGVNGAARKYANQYESQGWTLGRVGNAGTSISETVVYYSSTDYKSSAERVAKGLGGAKTEQSSKYQTGVTVLMGPDVAKEEPSKG